MCVLCLAQWIDSDQNHIGQLDDGVWNKRLNRTGLEGRSGTGGKTN